MDFTYFCGAFSLNSCKILSKLELKKRQEMQNDKSTTAGGRFISGLKSYIQHHLDLASSDFAPFKR